MSTGFEQVLEDRLDKLGARVTELETAITKKDEALRELAVLVSGEGPSASDAIIRRALTPPTKEE